MPPIRRTRELARSFSGRIEKTAILLPSALLVALGEGMVNLGLVFFLRESYRASPSLIGWIVGYSTSIYILGCLLLRPLFDTVRPHVLLGVATSGMAFSVLLVYLLPGLTLTFLFIGLYKLACSFFWPPVMGWLSQGLEGAQLNRVTSRFNLSWSLGVVISPLLAGLASERSAGLPLLGAALVFLASFLLLLSAILVLPQMRGYTRQDKPSLQEAQAPGRSTALRFPAWVGFFTGYMVSGVIATVFPLFARDVLSTSKSLIGVLLSSRTFFQSLGFLLLGALSFWHFKARYLLLGQLYLVLLLVGMTQARTLPAFGVLLPLLGTSTAFSYATSLFHGIAGSRRRASRMAIHESLLNGGYIAGASAGGILYQEFSMSVVLFFCLASALAALLAQGGLLLRLRRLGRAA